MFFMQGIFSVCCLEHGRKITILLYFPPVLVCIVSNDLLTVPSLSGEVWQLLTISVPDQINNSRAALGFRQPSKLVEFDQLLHVHWVILWMWFKHRENLSYCFIASSSFIAGWEVCNIQTKSYLLSLLCWKSYEYRQWKFYITCDGWAMVMKYGFYCPRLNIGSSFAISMLWPSFAQRAEQPNFHLSAVLPSTSTLLWLLSSLTPGYNLTYSGFRYNYMRLAAAGK